ncbi:MAG: hypothetical protein WBH35_02370 [Bacillota bacterium]|nr:hypothetical protein [Bacillota bacterium]HPZ55322.1 hypothetical protein [Bacillota bacterium]HQD19087.1 hypothetical protein [Bacillota bacterium]
MTVWLQEQAVKLGVPFVELTGAETRDEAVAICVDAAGAQHPLCQRRGSPGGNASGRHPGNACFG